LRAGDRRILLDCGAATVASLKRFGEDTARVDLVLVTHFHGDHVAGLGFLYHDYQHATLRKTPLIVAGPPGIQARVEGVYRAMFPGVRRAGRRFRVRYRVLRAGRVFDPEGCEGVRVVPFRVRHQADRTNFGYELRTEGRRIVYTGDTGWFPGLVRLARGADLFVCECTHTGRGGARHLSLAELRARRDRLAAKRILLTHLGPGFARKRRVPGFLLARDGMRLSV
jgi:ribonuclease BN (tRNA processing enzyme)